MSKETKGHKLLQQTADRRQVLKVTIAGAATLLLLPTKWSVPMVRADEVPSHCSASAPPKKHDYSSSEYSVTTTMKYPTTTPDPCKTPY